MSAARARFDRHRTVTAPHTERLTSVYDKNESTKHATKRSMQHTTPASQQAVRKASAEAQPRDRCRRQLRGESRRGQMAHRYVRQRSTGSGKTRRNSRNLPEENVDTKIQRRLFRPLFSARPRQKSTARTNPFPSVTQDSQRGTEKTAAGRTCTSQISFIPRNETHA